MIYNKHTFSIQNLNPTFYISAKFLSIKDFNDVISLNASLLLKNNQVELGCVDTIKINNTKKNFLTVINKFYRSKNPK